jgi:glycosyltransferase
MKISIITTVKNDQKGFEQTFESVLQQSYQNIEYIVIDASDEDRKLDKNSLKDAQYHSQQDLSPYEGMNAGIELASGNVIALLHAGDIFLSKDTVSHVMSKFLSSNADAVYGDIVYHAKDDTSKIVRKWVAGKLEKKDLENGVFPPHTALFVKRDIYEKIGNFDVDFKITADADLMLRMFRLEGVKVEYMSEIMLSMRIGGRSNRNLLSVIKGNLEFVKILRKQKVANPVLKMVRKVLSKVVQYF